MREQAPGTMASFGLSAGAILDPGTYPDVTSPGAVLSFPPFLNRTTDSSEALDQLRHLPDLL